VALENDRRDSLPCQVGHAELVDEEPIEVRRYGDVGPEIVLLHGGPGSPGHMAPLARELAPRFRVIEPLQRRRERQPLTVDRHVDDLAAVAPDPAVLVGSSWGAMLALSFASTHPERVRCVALIGCGTYSIAGREAYHRTMNERLDAAGRARMAEIAERFEEETGRAERDRLLAAAADLASRAQSVDPITTDWEFAAFDADGHDDTWQDVLRRQEDGREPGTFSAIRVPVLMIHGADDPHPGAITRDVLRTVLPQIEYVELAQCGHMPWVERHARHEFLQTLQAWLLTHGIA
jgi:pimeloyl-ACP methyl ester carboxylesterase